MPVQTRASGQASAPPKVYRSSAAAPKQRKFPHRHQHLRTYGRTSKPKLFKQDTLTQMNFVSPTPADFADILSSAEEEEEEEAKPKSNRKSKNKGKRRKTLGDELNDMTKPKGSKRRRTMGDVPSSSQHTLTQLLSFNENEDKENWKINDSEEEEEEEEEGDLGLIKDTPKSEEKKTVVPDPVPDAEIKTQPASSSVTPSNRGLREVPSSQSPATPMLLKYSPAKQVSPLKGKSTNASASTPTIKSIHKTPRNRVIQDSYSTAASSPATPTPKTRARASTVKKLRFELPEDKENITPGRTKPKSPKVIERASNRQPLIEVPDSDEELETDIEGETEDEVVSEEEGTPSPEAAVEESVVLGDHETTAVLDDGIAEVDASETDYVAGKETQALLISSSEKSSLDLGVKDAAEAAAESSTSPYDEAGTEHQPAIENTPEETSPNTTVVQTPIFFHNGLSEQRPEQHTQATETQYHTQAYTQCLESQRVPIETINAIGSISDRSDIIISIYTQHVDNMVKRVKNHEFRSFKIPDSVYRVWIYITKPESVLKYMCIFGPAKCPGEIDEDGVGNADFNQGRKKGGTYAYEVQQMYLLNNPVTLDQMREYGWPTAPQRFAYIPPAVVGQLTANLRCALFHDDKETYELPQSSPKVTVSQELEDQIRSDIVHSTQLGPSEQDDVIPSSQSPPKTAKRNVPQESTVFKRPSLPKPLSGSLLHMLPSSPNRHGLVPPSQATTISQVSSSSPVNSPHRSTQLPAMVSSHSQANAPSRHSSASSPTSHRRGEHSLRSSQFPSKSQMLPDSLLPESIHEPPPIIWDSADDMSD